MRYLFFDIECCNGRDLCEFGYVVTDTDFNVIQKENLTINPESQFRLTGRFNQKDLILNYRESTYNSSPKFRYYYDKIKDLLEYSEQIIIGHSISNDANFIKIACKRYVLPPINFKFIDSQKIYNEYFNEKNKVSLENAGIRFSVEFPKYLHKSDDDSLLTMRLVNSMCQGMEVTLEELIDLCPSCSGKMDNFEISFDNIEPKIKKLVLRAQQDTSNFIRKNNYYLFMQFLDGVKAQEEIVKSEITGKSLSISINYELNHFKEMLSLIQLITNHGATYKLKASENDIFVTYPMIDETGNERTCTRLKYVNEAIRKGKQIKIIDFRQLLEILKIKEDTLLQMPFPKEDSFFKRQEAKVITFEHKKKQNKASTTIGDFFRAQGIDLGSLISKN